MTVHTIRPHSIGLKIDNASIAATPKRERTRLARAELLMLLASTAERLDDYSTRSLDIAARYGLNEADFRRALSNVGGQIETLATRSGFEEHWDD